MSNNQPNLQRLLQAVQINQSDEYTKEAIDAIYAAGLSAIGSNENPYGVYELDACNALRAEQRKAWKQWCYGEGSNDN